MEVAIAPANGGLGGDGPDSLVELAGESQETAGDDG
jgi:hypothetical protein